MNPARAQAQLIGAPSRGAAKLIAEALAKLNLRRERVERLWCMGTMDSTRSALVARRMFTRSLVGVSNNFAGRLPILALRLHRLNRSLAVMDRAMRRSRWRF